MKRYDAFARFPVRFTAMLFIGAIMLLLIAPVPAHARVGEYRFHLGPDFDGKFGFSVTFIGDQGLDGYGDYAVGAPDGQNNDRGAMYIYDGLTGDLVTTLFGDANSEEFGYFILNGGADFDDDDIEDFYIGDPEYNTTTVGKAGAVLVCSGATGIPFQMVHGEQNGERFGHGIGLCFSVVIDGQGRACMPIGAPNFDAPDKPNAGRAGCYVIATGEKIYDFVGEEQGDRVGYSISANLAQGLVTSAPGGGAVYSLNGGTGELDGIYGGPAAASFGTSVALAGDVNNDGTLDVIVGAPFDNFDWLPGQAYIFSGADGSLLHLLKGSTPGDQFGKSVAPAGDVDGDNFEDVLIGTPGFEKGRAEVRSGKTGQVLRYYVGKPSAERFGSAVANAGDVNNDGLLDVIVGDPSHGSQNRGAVYVFLGGATNILDLDDVTDPVSTGSAQPIFSIAADLNGDHRDDLVSVSKDTNRIAVQLANDAGEYGPPTLYPAGDEPTSAAAADFDGDGDPDVAVASSKTNKIIMFKTLSNGTLDKIGSIQTGKRPYSVVAGDFNYDGAPDLAVANRNDDQVWVHLNDAFSSQPLDERFFNPKKYNVQDKPVFLATGDVNGDPWIDLVVINRGDDKVSVLLNKHDNGKFFSQKVTPIGADTLSVAVGDFDADGYDDIAYLGDVTDQISVRLSNGNGYFANPTQIPTGPDPKHIVAFDMDFDGWLEMATANAGDSSMTLFLNVKGDFSSSINVPTGGAPAWLTTGDLDMDQDDDLITVSTENQAFSTHENLWLN